MLPDFIIIGAHKAGTSSLYMYLQQHPRIFMPELKEPRFFCYDENNPAHNSMPRRVFPVRSMQEYEALFEQSSPGNLIGEASPEYLNSAIAAERIHKAIPDVKLIASLRNPVDRAYSLYQMTFRAGTTRLDFRDWFFDRLNGDDYTKQTLFYYANLKRYFDCFKPEQIKVCLFDDIKSDSMTVVADMYDYLGVSRDFTPDTSVRYNEGGLPKNKLVHKILSNRRLILKMKPFIPSRLLDFGKKTFSKNLEKAPAMDDNLRNELKSIYQDDINQLETLIDRDLSIWQ